MSKHQESFPVLSISREDVTHAMGYNLGAVLSDDQMRVLASKLGDALSEIVSELGFWSILANMVETRWKAPVSKVCQPRPGDREHH